MVMVQGIADCVFEEKGRLVVLDYKTDRVKDRRVRVEHDAPQLGAVCAGAGRNVGASSGTAAHLFLLAWRSHPRLLIVS